MTRFFTSDHHFGHKNIITYEKRPFFRIQEMDEAMIARWNAVVRPFDTVFHLGDFALCKRDRIKELWRQLNGVKVLIRGNHDRSKKSCEEMGIVAMDALTICIGHMRVRMQHKPFTSGQEFNEDFVLHGHIHGKDKTMGIFPRHINVGVDAWNYMPVPEEDIVHLMSLQQQGSNLRPIG